jgi:hypothetical protein
MEDTDVIAYLYPYYDEKEPSTYAIQTIEMDDSCPRLVKPKHVLPPLPTQRSRRSRAPTEPLEEEQHKPLDRLPCLKFRFSHGPRTSHGFVFGKDEVTSDVVLPDLPAISNCHYTLTFEKNFQDVDKDVDEYRLVLRDLGSFNKIIVQYDGKGGEPRRNFRWILSGHDAVKRVGKIVIAIPPTLKFQLVVASHVTTSPMYIDKVKRDSHRPNPYQIEETR